MIRFGTSQLKQADHGRHMRPHGLPANGQAPVSVVAVPGQPSARRDRCHTTARISMCSHCGVVRRSHLGVRNVVSCAYRAVMNDSCRVDVVDTIVVGGSGLLPDPDKFAAAARRAALSRASGSQLMFAYTARQVITSVTLAGLPDESAAVSAALDVVSEALRLAPPSRRRDWGAFDKPAGG
jgi:hypothetical protein